MFIEKFGLLLWTNPGKEKRHFPYFIFGPLVNQRYQFSLDARIGFAGDDGPEGPFSTNQSGPFFPKDMF